MEPNLTVDRYTLVHAGVGAALAAFGASSDQAAAVALVWELAQGPVRTLFPGLPLSDQPLSNAIVDAGALVLGHWAVKRVVERQLT